MDESSCPSNKIPEILISFQVNPVVKLEHSLSSLCDIEFNPNGMAMVDITEKGFEITVRNAESEAVGYLFLKPSGLSNFRCTKPILGKMINLAEMYQLMVDGTDFDDDFVTICHLDGSNCLTFVFESDPDNDYDIELFEMDVEIERIPDIVFFCEAVFTTEMLRQMLVELIVEKRQLVSVNVAERLVTALIGSQPWILQYENQKITGIRGMSPGQMHHAWFILPHLRAMWKASFVEPCFLVCFLSEPAHTVMVRFCFRQLGDLVFINKAELVIPNSHAARTGGGDEELQRLQASLYQ